MRNIIKTILLAILMFSSHTVSARTPVKVTTLKQYIKAACPRSCISDVLLTTLLKEESQRLRVDYRDFLAIVRVESSFNSKARNGSNVGLSQVHLKYHKKKFKGNPYDPRDNVKVGLSIYKACLTKAKGNRNKAYTCYNGGGDPQYVSRVNKARNTIINLKGVTKMTS